MERGEIAKRSYPLYLAAFSVVLTVPILIQKLGERYKAQVTPPHGRGRLGATGEPMTLIALIEALQEIGCYQTDIGDAFYEADPEWQFRLG